MHSSVYGCVSVRALFCSFSSFLYFLFFFFNDTATTEIYTLSLHDALPISDYFVSVTSSQSDGYQDNSRGSSEGFAGKTDRKSTRLNSSHTVISYAVFCLKKKKKKKIKQK